MTEDHAYQLGDWLNQYEDAAEHWPCNQLIEPLQAVWADGAANPQELQRLARVLISLQEEWALRKGAMATYYKSLEPTAAYSYVPKAPRSNAPLTPPRPVAPPSLPQRRNHWVLAAASVTILLVAAGLFAARELKSDHEKVGAASSSPMVAASPVPSVSTSVPPDRITAVRSSAKPATPSSAWTAVTRQNVKAKAGKREIVIPKGTTLKMIGRTDRDLMISYKGEDLTIPASATTPLR